MLNYIGWVVFAIVSWNILEIIIAACTNTNVRKLALLVLLVFSILNGYLMYLFGLDRGFILHILIFPIILFIKYRSIVKSMNLMVGFERHSNKQEAIALFDLEISETGVNYRETKLLFIISGIIYLLVFSGAYLYFYNSQF